MEVLRSTAETKFALICISGNPDAAVPSGGGQTVDFRAKSCLWEGLIGQRSSGAHPQKLHDFSKEIMLNNNSL